MDVSGAMALPTTQGHSKGNPQAKPRWESSPDLAAGTVLPSFLPEPKSQDSGIPEPCWHARLGHLDRQRAVREGSSPPKLGC